MLHHPPAHRRVIRPRIRTTRQRCTTPHRLFLGLGELPRGTNTHCEEIEPGVWVLLVRLGAEYGAVARDYAYGTHLPRWMGQRMYYIHGAVSPAVDPAAYCATHWWCDEWIVDEAALMTAGHMAAELTPRRGHRLLDILDPYAPRLTPM